jgi:hypothetical protein
LRANSVPFGELLVSIKKSVAKAGTGRTVGQLPGSTFMPCPEIPAVRRPDFAERWPAM